ncbi:nucleoside triphosphate pyrophosphohydrolase [Aquisalimonas sp.]|uniref:nucleoside triphosphate pyrophosphohydrolase n=1 Tax=unclassified Aquisalimonas TaxID=2644645 RepID=UPI0025C0154D|nr:nucleoside triphosphate pyrophosphohydrolase [Aquisalimonas sp.]
MKALQDLLALMATLRDPERGCPWDLQQDFHSIAPYTLEEAYEVADAIHRQAPDDLRDELGDLLFQVVFHAQMAREQGLFDFEAVTRGIHDKMVRRHPHVFGDAVSRGGRPPSWEAMKEAERRERGDGARQSALDGVPVTLPGLTRAGKITRRAARVHFDWPSADGVIAKVREELEELEEARASGSREAVEDEFGDLLFACANLGRHLGVDPERALRGANAKFERRFRRMEQQLADEQVDLAGSDMATKEAAWTRAKQAEKGETNNG